MNQKICINADLAPVYYNPISEHDDIAKRQELGSLGLKEFIVVVNIDVQSYGIMNKFIQKKFQINPKLPQWRTIAIAALKSKVTLLKSLLSIGTAKKVKNSLDNTEYAVIGNFFSFTGIFDPITVKILQSISGIRFIEEVMYATNDGNTLELLSEPSSVNQINKRSENSSETFTTYEKRADGIFFQRYAPWALSRISSSSLPSPIYPYGNGYTFKNGGDGVVVYVIDSGINIDHQEFQGRASFGPNIAFNSDGKLTEDNYDYMGHGTAVASMVGGVTFGAAKKAKIISYKIAAYGLGVAVNTMIQAINDINNIISTANDGRIASLAVCSYITTTVSPAWDLAVTQFTEMGYIYVASAGNNRADACNKSPISSLNSISVGSTDSSDGYQSTTNFGRCVDIYAPGVNVYTADYKTNYKTIMGTGTSYSAPLVAGICALILGDQPTLNLTQIKSVLLQISAKNVLKSTLENSVNVLAQVPLA
ncbi:Subtilase-type proteinase psp3 [Smittium culicis]|uniref:Subtilase-type proteinase psp3 n=1 Tax=Smittium culicis TaxID=133412 RepID=A0A1R1YFQ3_9FUNG|nr:Subtilase-type proteinase psp3 [Smittium culicis]